MEAITNIITTQLNKKSKTKIKSMSYYEEIPLRQVHIDTFFYTNDILFYPHPFLLIVDVATKYVNIIPQKRKNENIVNHVDEFCKKVQKKFPTAITDAKNITIISDDAKEFNVLNKKYNHKVSVSIHKAVFAETYIARVKLLVRKIVIKHYIQGIFEGKIKKIPKEDLLEMLELIEKEINKKARIKIKKIEQITAKHEPQFKLGDGVFIKSNEKFYEQLRKFKKKSYLDNFVMEPFYISDIVFFNGVYKYGVSSFFDHESDKYWHYEEEIQLINPEIVDKYINQYKIAYNSKFVPKNDGLLPK